MKISGIGFIYMITSPSGRIYIGSTIDVENRHQDYKCGDCKSQPKLYNSFLKYEYINHIVEIIWAGPIEDMLKYETLIGWGFNVLDSKNLNCKLPKLGDNYSVISEETRIKMKISHKERFQIMSIEKRKLLGKKRIGQKQSKESIEKRTKKVQKPIYQLNLNNLYIKKWDNATQAGKILNISSSDICQCCKNKKNSCGGFKWKYVNEELEKLTKPRKIRNNKFNKNKKAVIQMDLNKNFIKEWESIADARRGLNILGTHISSCCNNKRNLANGFKWKYKDENIFNNK